MDPPENTTASCFRQCSAKQSDEQNILRGLLGLKSPGTMRTLHFGLKHFLKAWNLKPARSSLRGRAGRCFRRGIGVASFFCSAVADPETPVGTAAIEPTPAGFPSLVFPFVKNATVDFMCGALLMGVCCFCIALATTLIRPISALSHTRKTGNICSRLFLADG